MTTKKAQPRGYLATPLERHEQLHVTRMYREHGGLVNHMGRKFCRKFRALRCEDVFSCIDIAFIKACRKWDPEKGAFSTVLGVCSEGEIRHFIRDHNWAIKAPGAVRELGTRARFMLLAGQSLPDVCTALKTDADTLKHALFAVQSLDHEQHGFARHVCPRPTPWEALEQSEALGVN
jgi:DNA-directed RNA polymerase specialized sigma subunit